MRLIMSIPQIKSAVTWITPSCEPYLFAGPLELTMDSADAEKENLTSDLDARADPVCPMQREGERGAARCSP
jgi:hypothetical protein